MNKEEMKEKMNELNEKMKELGEKTKDSIDTAKIKGMYAKDKIDEMANESKSNLKALKENFRIFSEKAKSKALSEILKAQMNMLAALEAVAAEKEYDEKYGNEE